MMRTDEKTVLNVLKKAHETLLSPERWVRVGGTTGALNLHGESCEPRDAAANRWSLCGALDAAATFDGERSDVLHHRASWYVEQAMMRRHGMRGAIIIWSTMRARTHDEIVAVLADAIEQAQSDAALVDRRS